MLRRKKNRNERIPISTKPIRNPPKRSSRKNDKHTKRTNKLNNIQIQNLKTHNRKKQTIRINEKHTKTILQRRTNRNPRIRRQTQKPIQTPITSRKRHHLPRSNENSTPTLKPNQTLMENILQNIQIKKNY